MDDLFPALLVAALVGGAVVSYRILQMIVYRKDSRSDDRLERQQELRFRPYEHAAPLQVDINRLHDQAIRLKNRFELAGIGACAIAPALLVLAAVAPHLVQVGLGSDRGLFLAQAAAVLTVLCILVIYRNPTKEFLETRLRAEYLRSHLHCLLVGVGPYRVDESWAIEALRRSKSLDQLGLLDDLRLLERQCLEQSIGSSLGTAIPLSMAETYFIERVGEQVGDSARDREGYFQQASATKRRSSRVSALLVEVSVVVALVVSCGAAFDLLPRWLAPTPAFAACGAIAMFCVAGRSMLGWDSKAALYFRQLSLLNRHAEDLHQFLREAQASGAATVSGLYQVVACRFEALMAREACDFVLISDRETFDISF